MSEFSVDKREMPRVLAMVSSVGYIDIIKRDGHSELKGGSFWSLFAKCKSDISKVVSADYMRHLAAAPLFDGAGGLLDEKDC
jgi:hypothetical protein